MSQSTPESRPTEPTGAPAPVLSYKKRQNKTPPLLEPQNPNSNAEKTPVLASPNTPLSAPGTPTLGSNRKVLNRRKALQDFYKMNAAIAGENNDIEAAPETAESGEGNEKNEESSDFDADKLLSQLSNDEAMREFLKTASSHEILRARNAAADKLNFHDLERKSIIYNNYSELIKLNQILADVFDEKRPGSEFDHVDETSTVTHKTIDDYLAGLAGFLETEAAVFNQDFASVVDSLCANIDGADSVSSIAGIAGKE